MSINTKSKRTTHDLEFKQQAVQLLNTTGRPLAQIARELGFCKEICVSGFFVFVFVCLISRDSVAR